MTSVGELVPFLFPSHWLNIKENEKLLIAQQLALTLVKLDSMRTTEALSLAAGRDHALWEVLKEDRKLHSQIEAEIRAFEIEGKLKGGSTLGIESAGNNLDQTIANLESIIPLDINLLSIAVGFVNPSAIGNLTVEPLGNIEEAGCVVLRDLERITIEASLEIRQLQALLEAAQTSKINRGVQWMSPTGDLKGALGVSLPVYIEIGASQIRDLLTMKDQIHSRLLHKVLDAFNDYYKSLDSYQFAVKGVLLQETRIKEARELIRNSNLDNVHDLRDALQLLSVNHSNLIIAQYAWYDSISKLNRLLLQGPYAVVAESQLK
jgi:hypothetical protein